MLQHISTQKKQLRNVPLRFASHLIILKSFVISFHSAYKIFAVPQIFAQGLLRMVEKI